MKNFWLEKKKKWGMMGLGLLGSSEVRFIRKWRYTIEFHHDSKIIVEPRFVKVEKRPALCVPSERELSVIYYGVEATESDNISIVGKVEDVTAHLKLYDGCGCPLEQWDLSGIKIVKFEFDGYQLNINLSYNVCMYKNLTIFTDGGAIGPIGPLSHK